MSDDLDLYVVNYKPFSYPIGSRVFKPFVVGKDDRSGENLADFGAFSETRCHYWAWRNKNPPKFIGFHQYRRSFLYLPLMQQGSPFFGYTEWAHAYPGAQHAPTQQGVFCRYLEWLDEECNEALPKWLEGIDMVVPRPMLMETSLEQHYCFNHKPADWRIFANLLNGEGLNPGTLPFLTACNMFIMRSDLFSEYMTLWWRVMDRMKDAMTPPDEGRRGLTLGYLSERLFTVWLYRKRCEQPRLRIEALPFIFAEFA